MKKSINIILVAVLYLSMIGGKESVVLEDKIKSVQGVKSFDGVETPVKKYQYNSVLEDIESIAVNLIDNALKYSIGETINIDLYKDEKIQFLQ